MAFIDLHIHTCFSHDGDTRPERIVEMAAEKRITHLAITDHNRVDGNSEALRAARAHGVTVIPGIEIDCHFGEANLHVLGYCIDYEDRRYSELWNEVKARKIRNNSRRLRRVQELGFHVERDAVLQKTRDGVLPGIVIGEHVLANPDNADAPELTPFRPGGEKSVNPVIQFCWTYLTKGKPAYVEDGSLTLSEAVELVRATGGFPVLAHPGSSIPEYEDYLPGILAAGVVGVEVYCGYHTPEMASHWKQLAQDNGALISCGSDFHGSIKPAISLGAHGGDVDERAIVDSLFSRHNPCMKKHCG